MEDEGILPLHQHHDTDTQAPSTPECPRQVYTDFAPNSSPLPNYPGGGESTIATETIATPAPERWSDEATLPSTVAIPHEAPIAIAPENVQVVHQEDTTCHQQEEDSHFVKNTQHVIIA